MQKIIIIFTVVLIILALPWPGAAMSNLNPLKACTFSEMQISLFFDGKPATGAKITRTIEWRKEHVDEFTADGNGQVTLPAEFENYYLKFFPMEFVSAQFLTVQYEGKEYEIWNYAKRKTELNSEMDGEPLKLSCELTSESITTRAFGSILGTRCTLPQES
ncbi:MULTISPECIES: DUF4198 domain-containing protein [Microbulbifer]|uniref:DUF4198 domain-containing protein n=1 Tax=Microbulbifer TaxID=48073 RepID=UPI001CD68A30|nr:DUF4198 domain-containing protein [Microbulbifer agarilyticus]MCA0900318.1 DUF4198 domain-containing protein [Microbulbifer agarilyticus]